MAHQPTCERTLNDFFDHWVYRHKVEATVEGGLKFKEAREAWWNARRQHGMTLGMLDFTNRQLIRERKNSEYHKARAEEWLAAYQQSRVKNIGDYSRMFIRRPKLRRIVLFLLRFG